jgi:hypothetical protein
MEPVIRAALFVVVMEELVENMSLIHRARRSRKDLFIRYILGRQPADPGSWPPPDEVVARLEELDAS